MVIVIPCYKEKEVLFSLMALAKCDLPQYDVEVIIVINDSVTDIEEVKAQNMETYWQIRRWIDQQPQRKLRFYVLYQDNLPPKHAGVGLARKIGMDEACWRFTKIRNKKGIIVCFDADSRCEKNYLVAIEDHFLQHPKTPACSIHFEHPLEGIHFEDKIYQSILLYELHLRYFIHMQKWVGVPYAYQTIGSSMAVRMDAYIKQGGMNKRKAGEDFYFLHKFIQLGHFTELVNTTVIPSPRISDRVPFGTGKAVGEIKNNAIQLMTYHPQSFIDLKVLIDRVGELYKSDELLEVIPNAVQSFLEKNNIQDKLAELRNNTASSRMFKKRFFHWLNAFMLMKYVHYTRDHYYPNVSIEEASDFLIKLYASTSKSSYEKLILLRKIDKGAIHPSNASAVESV